MNTAIDIKSQVKTIVESYGIDADKALEIAEKCYADIPMWRPWGGATSFAQIDSQKAANEYAMQVDMETSALRGIINNITDSTEMTTDEKASTIAAAAGDYRTRINALEVGSEKSLWERFKSFFREEEVVEGDKMIKHEGGKYVVYSHDGSKKLGTYDSEAEAKKRLAQIEAFKEAGEGFKVIHDQQGNYRWISVSSNAYEDHSKELFTTKALEEAIEHADNTGERGPLLFFHVKEAQIGQCDFQALAGRFLIESGTFDDTPLGHKAMEQFADSDQEYQVSIGYKYRDGDEKDGQYDWLRISERSVCPYGTAANPWTEFKVVGEKQMEERKVAALKSFFGDEVGAGIISMAETRTKEMDESGIRFKEATNDTPEEKPAEETPAGTPEPQAVSSEVVTEALKEALAPFAEVLTTLGEAIVNLRAEVKELKASDEDKMGKIMTPRVAEVQLARPSESSDNLIGDAEKIAAALKEDSSNESVNPAKVFVDQLLGIRPTVSV